MGEGGGEGYGGVRLRGGRMPRFLSASLLMVVVSVMEQQDEERTFTILCLSEDETSERRKMLLQ